MGRFQQPKTEKTQPKGQPVRKHIDIDHIAMML